MIEYINEISPDIIQLHNLHGYYLNISILLNYLAVKNIPVVWTFHDCWPMTGHCSHFDFIGCEKWKTICFNCPQKKEYPASYGFDRSRKNFILKKKLFTSINNLTIVTVSNWLRNIVKQSYFSEFPIQIINNGIDNEIFRPLEESSFRTKYNLKNKFIILGVGSVWEPRKGLADFIKLSKNLDNNYQIILVGLPKLKLKTLPPNIIGINRTENSQELVEFYSNADVFINLSVEETFGLTTLEAFACGTPSIVYNATASPELITPETGFIVDKGDTQALVNAIKMINEMGKTHFSSECRERALKLFGKHDRYMEYLNLYESILSKRNGHAVNTVERGF